MERAVKQAAFRYEYGIRYTAEQTVFVDESSFDRRTSIRGKAWALSGQRAVRKCFFVRGRRQTTFISNPSTLLTFSLGICSSLQCPSMV